MHTKIATFLLKKPLMLEEFGLPRESQGLNSVFATDASTHAVIASANRKLSALA